MKYTKNRGGINKILTLYWEIGILFDFLSLPFIHFREFLYIDMYPIRNMHGNISQGRIMISQGVILGGKWFYFPFSWWQVLAGGVLKWNLQEINSQNFEMDLWLMPLDLSCVPEKGGPQKYLKNMVIYNKVFYTKLPSYLIATFV